MVAGTCNPSYTGGWGRIAWTWEVEIAVSQGHAIACQPGQQDPDSVRKKKSGEDYKDFFSDKQKLREFITTRPVWQKIKNNMGSPLSWKNAKQQQESKTSIKLIGRGKYTGKK